MPSKLVRCPTCNSKVSSAAPACPSCGETEPGEKAQEKALQARQSSERWAKRFLWAIVGFIGLVILASLTPKSPPVEAERASTEAVEPGEQSQTDAEPQALKPAEFSVPSDPKAKYFVLERGGTGSNPTLLTKRVGPSGTSYAEREFDCRNQTFRYLAEGDLIESMPRSKPDEKMSPVIDQSIAYYALIEACRTM